MSNITNRLQFLRCEQIFDSAAAIKLFREQWEYAHGQKPGEPIVFRYRDGDGVHTVISVSGIDGKETVYIDVDAIASGISALNAKTEELEGGLEGLAKLLSAYAKYCGADDSGIYDPSEPSIKGSKSLTDAVSMLANAVSEASRKLSAEKNDSDTVRLILDDDKQIVGAEVKVPAKSLMNGAEYANDLVVTKDGLFANVTLEYDTQTSELRFVKNGSVEKIQLPKEDYIESGEYDHSKESIVFRMKSGRKVEVDASKLISEWKAESTDTISLTRDRVKYDEGDYDWQDVLKAELRLHPGTHGIHNILKADPSGVYVDGRAKNILYTEADGTVTDLQRKIDSIRCEVSNEKGNIIRYNKDGLYASVSFSYDSASNTISFENGNGEPKEIKLKSFDSLEGFRYSETDNSLLFDLSYDDGTKASVSVPLESLWGWLKIRNDQNSPLQLSTDGGFLSGSIKVSSAKDNILEVKNGSLYVSGDASSITIDGEPISESFKAISAQTVGNQATIQSLSEKVETHTKRINNQKVKLDDLSARIEEAEKKYEHETSGTNEKIREVEAKVNAVQGDINSVRSSVTNLSTVIESIHGSVRDLSDKETSDIANINGKINDISQSVSSVSSEVAKKADSSDLSDLRSSLSSYATRTEMERELDLLERTVDTISSKTDAIVTQLSEKADRSSLSSVEKELDEVGDELSIVKSKVDAISKTVADEVKENIDVVSSTLPDGSTAYKLTYGGKPCSSQDIIVPKQTAVGSIVTNVSYAPETQKLTIEFSNGQKFDFSLRDLVDVYRAGDGLEVSDNTFSVKVDAASDKYITVSSSGVRISGISDRFEELAESVAAVNALSTENKEAISSILNDMSIRNFGDMVKFVETVRKQLDLHVQAAEAETDKLRTDVENRYDRLDAKIDNTKSELSTAISAAESYAENLVDASSAKIKGEIHDIDDKLSAEISKKADRFDVFNRETDTTKSALRLDMKTNGDGQKILYGNVEISTLPDNALKNSNGALYVSNNAKNVAYKNTNVASELDRMEKQIETLASGGTITVKVVSDDEHNVLHTGSDGGACFDGTLDYGTFVFP